MIIFNRCDITRAIWPFRKELSAFFNISSHFLCVNYWPIYEKHWFNNGSRLVFALHILLSRTRTPQWAGENGAPAIEAVRRFAEHATRCRLRGEQKIKKNQTRLFHH